MSFKSFDEVIREIDLKLTRPERIREEAKQDLINNVINPIKKQEETKENNGKPSCKTKEYNLIEELKKTNKKE
jgi:hypothetical protein